jgi:MazG family protein
MKNSAQTDPGIERLLDIMAKLRHPEDGCPWDSEQTFTTIAPYTIEEAYEVAEAIGEDDHAALCEELGDLLFQVIFHARMAEEAGAFAFADVVAAVCDKMVRRHPHIFADAQVADAGAQTVAWEAAKAAERATKAERAGRVASILDDVPHGFPALLRALKLQKRASRVGFDWQTALPALAKIEEEIGELRSEIAAGGSPERLADEIGDGLFSFVNVARHLAIDPESALRGTNAKFERRFRHIEAKLAASEESLAEMSLDDLDRLWEEAKSEIESDLGELPPTPPL